MSTRRSPLFVVLASLPLALSIGCASALGAGADQGVDETAPPPAEGRAAESASVGVDCSHPRRQTGYSHGSPFAITVVDADGHPIEEETAGAYARMQQAAESAGISLRVVSGFRTQAQQQKLYDDYLAGTGNLAARPGYSNHQSGHALDLNTSAHGVYAWLEAHGGSFGFERTVPSEKWHWEYWGTGGGCADTAPSGPSSGGGGGGCYSHTLGREVAENTCVQSSSDEAWYQCSEGRWEDRATVAAACSSEHPL